VRSAPVRFDRARPAHIQEDTMRAWLRQLDDLLRGTTTGPELLAGGRVELPLRTFLILALLLGATYGFFMGWFSLGERGFWGLAQLIASTLKFPALFLLTLLVTLPSLYVFNALIGCRLDLTATLRLLIAAIVINLSVAASLGPILGFFTVSTTSYTFIVLLNVALLAIAGIIGLGFLLQTLRRLSLSTPSGPPSTSAVRTAGPTPGSVVWESSPPETAAARTPGPLDPLPGTFTEHNPRAAQTIFRVWLVIYALVGAQMGWILRPFIGCPNMPFTLFRHRQGSFFQSVFNHFVNLFSTH
jgi:hypothetical protein